MKIKLQNNQVVSFEDNSLENMGDYCFYLNKAMTSLSLNSLKSMGSWCFYWNKNIKIKKQRNYE